MQRIVTQDASGVLQRPEPLSHRYLDVISDGGIHQNVFELSQISTAVVLPERLKDLPNLRSPEKVT